MDVALNVIKLGLRMVTMDFSLVIGLLHQWDHILTVFIALALNHGMVVEGVLAEDWIKSHRHGKPGEASAAQRLTCPNCLERQAPYSLGIGSIFADR